MRMKIRMTDGLTPRGVRVWGYTGRKALLPLVCGLLVVGAGVQASTVPFVDTFPYSNGVNLDGSNGWTVSGSGTVTAQGGSAQIVNSDTNDVTFANTFDDGKLAVSMTFNLQPVYTPGIPSGIFPSDSTFVFYVDGDGMINVYDGPSPRALAHDAVSDQFPTNFLVQVDYGISKWAISVGGVEIESGLGFYSGSHASFSGLGFIEAGLSATSVVDNVNIQEAVPATTTTAAATTTTTVTPTTTTTTTVPAIFSLPFEEPFDALTLGDLNGQRGWTNTIHAIVQTAVTRGGKACSITNNNISGKIEHRFLGDNTNVWAQLDVRPVRGEPRRPETGTTFAYYVNSNGVVMAYNGTTATNLAETFVPENAWVRFETHTDYANTNWDLYLNGRLIGEDLDFYSGNVTGFTEFGVYGGTSGVTYVDNIYLGESRGKSSGMMLIFR